GLRRYCRPDSGLAPKRRIIGVFFARTETHNAGTAPETDGGMETHPVALRFSSQIASSAQRDPFAARIGPARKPIGSNGNAVETGIQIRLFDLETDILQ